VDSAHERDNLGNFLAGEHHGDFQAFGGAFRIDLLIKRLFEDMLIEKHQGIHGLVLR
jgi:hypothetical protein